jgi:hypothetical protein
MTLGTSFAFPRNSVGFVGIYASTSARESRTSATFFTNHYSEIYDSSVLIFHVRVPTVAEPRFTEYIRATYFDLLGHSGSYSTPWGCFNRILELAVYDTAPPPPLWDTLNASFEKTSPILVNLESTTDDSIFIKITSDNTVDADPFYLHAIILENHMDLSGSPTGGYSLIGRDVLPSATGYKFTIAPNTTIDIHLAYERIPTWNHRELELAITIADSSSSEIIQACHGELPAPKYMHSVSTVGPVSCLIDPGDSIEFRIDINNFGGSPDTFAVKSSFKSPAGWTTEFCVSDTSFADSGFVLADTNSTEEISVYIKSDSLNPGIGTVEITLESQGGKTYTFYFSCASGGPVLVVDDAPSISGKYYRQVLDSLNADYFYFKRTDMFNMHNFDIVIWFTGSSNSSTLLESDQDAIAHFLMSGGKVFISGAQIGTDFVFDGSGTDIAFYQLYLGASGDPAKLLESSPILEVKGVDGNVISKGLSFNITGGDGADNSLISNVITPYDAQPIFYYGEGASFCAGVQSICGFEVIYLPFCFEAIDNFDDRFTLMKRILNWFDYYPNFISEMPVEQPISLSIKSYPNPFNAICEIQYSVPNSGSLLIRDITGRIIENLEISGSGIYSWNAKKMPSGIYFVNVFDKTTSLINKVCLIK